MRRTRILDFLSVGNAMLNNGRGEEGDSDGSRERKREREVTEQGSVEWRPEEEDSNKADTDTTDGVSFCDFYSLWP